MYKVLIVDDEPIAVESIAFMIKKNFEEIEKIETSRSGKDAIEKAYHLHPDIIIMDINMPGINGIDAIKQIRMVNPSVNFIIISAFDYFDYAVEAVALGVKEYLLKPVKESKFVETLNKLLQQIDQNNISRKRSLEQQERLEMIQPVLETGFMYALTMYVEDTKELKNYCDIFGYEGIGGYVMALEFTENAGQIDNRIGAGIQVEKMYEEYKNILKASFNCIVSPLMLNRIIVYIFIESEEGSHEQKSASIRAANKVLERVARICPDIYIGIGRYYNDIQKAKKSYQEALHALRVLSNMDKNASPLCQILHEGDISPKVESQQVDYAQLIEDDICAHVMDNDEENLNMAYEQMYEKMSSDPDVNFDLMKKLMIGMVVSFEKRWGSILTEDYYEELREIINANDEESLYYIGKNYLANAVRQITSGKQKKVNSIIEKADQYILEHYAEDISLEDIAKEVNLSSYYFSRFYKDMTGIGFSDKLVNVRIEKAKEYLKKEEYSIKDVSYMVGYMEPNYFSKIFKKATGLTASDYKKMYGL